MRGKSHFWGFLIVAEVLFQQVGFSSATLLFPLTGALFLATIGGVVLPIISIRFGLPSWAAMDAGMQAAVKRLAAGNLVSSVPYLYAAQQLGIAVTATVTSFGPLSVRFKHDLKHLLNDRWARRRMAVRGAAFLGIALVNTGPRTAPFTAETALGLACAALCAWSFWNYTKCVFGGLISDDIKRFQVFAWSHLLAMPGIWVLVGLVARTGEKIGFPVRFDRMSLRVILIGVGAALLVVVASAVISVFAGGKVPEFTSGILYMTDSALAAIVGAVGGALGLLSETQVPTLTTWIGIPVVAAAAWAASLMRQRDGA